MSSIHMPFDLDKGFHAQGGYTEEDREKLEKEIKAREKKYDYKRGSNANLTKPSKYANIGDSDFADPVGFNYPIARKYIHGAITYWQHIPNRHFYKDPKARAFITERIVRAALKFKVAISYDARDPDYAKLPLSLKKQMEGYDAKRSFLEDQAGFTALHVLIYSSVAGF